jgi:hypothetical protein
MKLATWGSRQTSVLSQKFEHNSLAGGAYSNAVLGAVHLAGGQQGVQVVPPGPAPCTTGDDRKLPSNPALQLAWLLSALDTLQLSFHPNIQNTQHPIFDHHRLVSLPLKGKNKLFAACSPVVAQAA